MKQGQWMLGLTVILLVVAGLILGAAVIFGDNASVSGGTPTPDQGFRRPVGD